MKFNRWHLSWVMFLCLVSLPTSPHLVLWPWGITSDSPCAMGSPVNMLLYACSPPTCHLLCSGPGELLLLSSKPAEMSSPLGSFLSLPNHSCHVFPQLCSMHSAHISLTIVYLNSFSHWTVLNSGVPPIFVGGMNGDRSWWVNVRCHTGQHKTQSGIKEGPSKSTSSPSSQCVNPVKHRLYH